MLVQRSSFSAKCGAKMVQMPVIWSHSVNPNHSVHCVILYILYYIHGFKEPHEPESFNTMCPFLKLNPLTHCSVPMCSKPFYVMMVMLQHPWQASCTKFWSGAGGNHGSDRISWCQHVVHGVVGCRDSNPLLHWANWEGNNLIIFRT